MPAILEDRAKLLPVLVLSVIIAVGAALVILFSGDETSGSPSAATGSSAPGQVEISNFSFIDETIEVEAGTEVTWTNRDTAVHVVLADDRSFDTGRLKRDEAGSYTFEEPGEYPYVCKIHASMNATVTVE